MSITNESQVKTTGQLPVITVGKSGTKPTWCPGCGDYGVLAGVERAVKMLDLPPHEVLIVSGIGCSSNLPHFLNSYGFHAIHGRAVAVAEGAKLANHGLHVIVTGGDGDGYGIGVGHLIHAMRRNIDLTYVVMNNEIYGLTTGQASPTSLMGAKTKSTPLGVIEQPINPIALALSSGATYVARAFSGDVKHMGDLIAGGIRHKGFSLIDVLSPCVTYNHLNSYDYFRQRVYKLENSGHDPSQLMKAYEKSFEWEPRVPTGLFYQVSKPTYEDLEPALKAGPLAHQPVTGLKGKRDLLEEFV